MWPMCLLEQFQHWKGSWLSSKLSSVLSVPTSLQAPFSCCLFSLRLSQRVFWAASSFRWLGSPGAGSCHTASSWRLWRECHLVFFSPKFSLYISKSKVIYGNDSCPTVALGLNGWISGAEEQGMGWTPQIQTSSCLKHLGIMHSSNALFFSHFTWCVSRWAKA